MIRPGVRRLFRLNLRPGHSVEQDVSDEIALHLELRARALEAQGLSPNAAYEEARRRFGSPGARGALCREAGRRDGRLRLREWADGVRQDLRLAARAMGHRRSASVFVIATLALAMAVSATAVAFADAFFFQMPPDVTQPDRLVRVFFNTSGTIGSSVTGQATDYRTYMTLRRRVPEFQETAAYSLERTSVGSGASVEPANAVVVSRGFFRTLGVSPALGRFFTAMSSQESLDDAAILSYALWLGRFGGDASIIGHSLRVGGRSYTVIGVAPARFTGVEPSRADVWLPLDAATTLFSPNALTGAPDIWLRVVARLRSGVGANAAARRATDALSTPHSTADKARRTQVLLAPLPIGRGPRVSISAKLSLWLAVTSGVVLLMACATIGALLIARTTASAREVRIRAALGAGRWRIARQLLVESFFATGCAGAAAAAVEYVAGRSMQMIVAPDVVWPWTMARALALVGAMTFVSGVLCAAGPLWSLRSSLPLTNARHPGLTGGRRRLRGLLIGAQTALAVIVLSMTALLVHSFLSARGDIGVDVDHLLYARLPVRSAPARSTDTAFPSEAVLRRLRALPGVASASFSAGEPFGSGWAVGILPTNGAAARIKPPDIAASGRAVSIDYFQTTQQRFIAGRPFSVAEHRAAAPVAILNRSAAQYYWKGASPIGECVRVAAKGPCLTIVGVVGDAGSANAAGGALMEIYVPIETLGSLGRELPVDMLEVRTDGDPSALVPAVRQSLAADTTMAADADVRPLLQIVAPQYGIWKFGAEIDGSFALLALLFALAGLYGTMAYTVLHQQQELALRAALGATRGALVRAVARRSILTVLIGAGIGCLGSFALRRALAPMLYAVSGFDPVLIGSAATTLIVLAFVAAYWPTRSALRVDPARVLRTD
jgi:putative ABC transport system permease protein